MRLTHDTDMHGSRRRNCARAATWIRNHPGHRLYLLCELFAVGYSDDVLKALPLLAEPLDGESVTYFQKVPRSLMQLYPRRRSHALYASAGSRSWRIHMLRVCAKPWARATARRLPGVWFAAVLECTHSACAQHHLGSD